MRLLSPTELDRIKILTEYSVELSLLEPTRNGLEKSIMDATTSVRAFLKTKRLHDYDNQKQGPEHKILITSTLLSEKIIIPSIASLYRPKTKEGDPRIWFKGLKGYANPNEVIGLVEYNQQLFIINISRLDVRGLLLSKDNNPLKELILDIKGIANLISDELLELLRKIAQKGPVPALLNADTAIGRTLETLLGININSSKQPDYKGIELKSFRGNRTNRKSLFAQVPSWTLSKFKSSAEILNNFGYLRDKDFKLYCTVSTLVSNSQGLRLKIDTELNQLIEFSNKNNIGDFAVWALQVLHQRLIEKHNETFWISAETSIKDGTEYFLYDKVLHTRKPILSQFDILLEQGIITLDHLIKRTPDGKVVEKGPLFKIKPSSVGLLFPPSISYSLK